MSTPKYIQPKVLDRSFDVSFMSIEDSDSEIDFNPRERNILWAPRIPVLTLDAYSEIIYEFKEFTSTDLDTSAETNRDNSIDSH